MYCSKFVSSVVNMSVFPNLKELFYNSKYIKIEDPEYSSIKLMLETE